LELESLITNLNKNQLNLDEKINRLVNERNYLKQLNSDSIINIVNQQKVFPDFFDVYR